MIPVSMPATNRDEAEEEPLLFAHAVKVGGDHPVSSATPVSTLKHQDEEDGVPEKGKGARLHRAMDCLALMFFVVIAIVIREIIYGPGHALQNGGSNRNVVGEKSVAVGTGIAVQTTNLLEGKDSEAASSGSMTERPNIVVIFIDDQGFNDMGPNSTDLWWATPTILGFSAMPSTRTICGSCCSATEPCATKCGCAGRGGPFRLAPPSSSTWRATAASTPCGSRGGR